MQMMFDPMMLHGARGTIPGSREKRGPAYQHSASTTTSTGIESTTIDIRISHELLRVFFASSHQSIVPLHTLTFWSPHRRHLLEVSSVCVCAHVLCCLWRFFERMLTATVDDPLQLSGVVFSS